MEDLNSTERLVVMIVWLISVVFFLTFATIIYKKCGHIEGEEGKKKAG